MKKYELTVDELAKLCRDFQADCFDGFISSDVPYIKLWLKKKGFDPIKYKEYLSFSLEPRMSIKKVDFPEKNKMSFIVSNKDIKYFEKWFEKIVPDARVTDYKISSAHCQIVFGTKLKKYKLLGVFPCNIDFRSREVTLSIDQRIELKEDGHNQ